MIKAILAAMAGSQTKVMGMVGGVSLLINQFRHEISLWVSELLGHTVRAEILNVLFSLFTVAMIATVFVAFVLYLGKSIARIRKSNRLAGQLLTSHMTAVAGLSEGVSGKKAASADVTVMLRSSLSALVSEVERLQKRSKRLRKHDPQLNAAFEEYVQKLMFFSAASGGARVSNDEPVKANLAETTAAAFALVEAFGYVEKGRRFRKQKQKTEALAVEVDTWLTQFEAPSEEAPTHPPVQDGSGSEARKSPDVIVRAQNKRSNSGRMSRRERRKLGPMDQPGKVMGRRSTDGED